jgi:hypothetical protein
LGKDGLGVDVIDLRNGSDSVGSMRIDEGDASALINSGLSFAGNDDVTLDVDGSDVAGTAFDAKLSSAAVLGLAGLGVDTVNLRIDQDQVQGLLDSKFAFADTLGFGDELTSGLALNVTLDATGVSEGFGTYLGGLDDGKGKALQDLASLGIDKVELLQSTLIDALRGFDNPETEEIEGINWNSFASASSRPELSVQIDSGSSDLDRSVVDIVGGLLDAGVMFNQELSLGDLYTALTDSLETVKDAGISGFKATETTNVVMSDELAQALSEAGMLEAVPAAKVVIDAGANALLKTPFKLLAELGVNQIQSANDRVFIELGINDPTEFADLVSGLLEQQGEGGTLFEGSTTAGTLVVRDSAALLKAIEEAGKDLKSLGFDEVAYVDSTDSIRDTSWTSSDLETAAVKIELLGGNVSHDVYTKTLG